jgi:hypothetical protein
MRVRGRAAEPRERAHADDDRLRLLRENHGKTTDVETQRKKVVKRVVIDHRENKVVVEYDRVPIEIGHVCNERIKKRPVDDDGYRSSKK